LYHSGDNFSGVYWTCSTTPLVAEQVLQNTLYFAIFSGSCSETEVSEQLYCRSIMDIKAVVFDYGQVISLPQDPTAMDRIAKNIGVDRNTLDPLFWSLRDDFDRGTLDSKGYYREVLSRLGKNMSGKEIEETIAIDFASWSYVNPETVALMTDIKNAGYTLGILSNMPREFLSWARISLPVFALPQIALFSCEVNLIKPEPAIYQTLLSQLHMQGSEVIFFDDKPINIEAAKAFGIKAFVWESAEKSRTIAASLGVKL